MRHEEEITAAAENLARIYRRLEDKTFFLGLGGQELSYTANKIAALKARLVDVKREAELGAKHADTHYKQVKANVFKRLTTGEEKVSATAAATLLYGELDVVEASEELNEAEALWNFVKSLVADGHDQIEAIRSRLIDMQSSRKDEGIR